MGSAPSPLPSAHGTPTEALPYEVAPTVRPPLPVKMVIAGGFGVGKTTAVAAVSEITPLTTEASITEVAAGVDDVSLIPHKTTTTVAMDFGCLTLDPTLKLYLFGTPGQDRFGFMWDDVTEGALGALVVVDSRRLDDCFPAVDYFERKGMPFAVAVNTFDGDLTHPLDAVREALDVGDEVPVISFDARDQSQVRDSLVIVLEHALARAVAAA
jgi:signal recognition particle receptor subunit beta